MNYEEIGNSSISRKQKICYISTILVLIGISIFLVSFFMIKLTEKNKREKISIKYLLLSSNDLKVFRSVELHIKGPIIVTDEASLVFVDCLIVAELEFNKQFYLQVQKKASFTVINCQFETLDGKWYNWEYYDQAKITHIGKIKNKK